MKYLLADVLVYNDEDGSLSRVDAPDEELQILTGTANAIMQLLVIHHGNVVEREVFLSEVWDERGLQGSNNSLNQYISILRKMLVSQFPDTRFIITIPKTGFMLSADIPVQPLRAERKEVISAEKPRHGYPARLLCIAMTLLVMTLCFWSVVIKQQQDRTPLYLLTRIGKCPVYTFTPLADVFRGKAISLTQAIQHEGNRPCLNNSVFYLHIQNTLFYDHEGRLVLSPCSLTKSKARACRTLYYYKW